MGRWGRVAREHGHNRHGQGGLESRGGAWCYSEPSLVVSPRLYRFMAGGGTPRPLAPWLSPATRKSLSRTEYHVRDCAARWVAAGRPPAGAAPRQELFPLGLGHDWTRRAWGYRLTPPTLIIGRTCLGGYAHEINATATSGGGWEDKVVVRPGVAKVAAERSSSGGWVGRETSPPAVARRSAASARSSASAAAALSGTSRARTRASADGGG